MRLHALWEAAADGQPCGGSHIRILRPFQYLVDHPDRAKGLVFSQSNSLPEEKIDVLVLERLWKDGGISIPVAENLVASLRARQIPFVYFIDDDLIDLNRFGELGARPSVVDRFLVGYFLREADGVVVSTEALANRFSPFVDRVVVLPNALDERLFPTRRRKGDGPLTIGYMGTFTHLDDLMSVLQPLRDVLHRHRGQVRLQIVGISRDSILPELFAGYDFEILEPVGCYHYPDFVSWAKERMHWDIGIAPLADTPFNRCKSDIKYLDYALLGIAGIYSDLPPYQGNTLQESVRDGQTGLLASTPQSWIAALEKLITDPVLRDSLAENAYTEVSSSRTLSARAGDWLEVIECALEN